MLFRHMRAILLAGAGAGALVSAPVGAQDIPLDRWLVASAEVEAGEDPLTGSPADRFPERYLQTETGVWTLVRRDGEARFDFSEWTEPGEATLAHAYLRAASDTDMRLALGVEACAGLRAWLNGQTLSDPERPREVRLAGGWNTLLVVLDGEPGCDRSLSATLSSETGPNQRNDSGSVQVTVQASRPPGVQPNYPEGVVTVSAPRVTSLAWNPGQDDLVAAISYDLATWGREAGGGGAAVDAPGVQRPGAPPGGPPTSPFDAPRRGGGDPSGAAAGDDEMGPTDPDGMRARMVAQLRGRPVVRGPAPRTGSVELRLSDQRFVAAGNDLRPGSPVSFDGSLPFRKLREAALRENGMRAEFRWGDDEAEGEAPMAAAPVLLAVHGPLDLGLEAGPDGVWRGQLRVPDVLAGFTVRGLEGAWSVDGAPAADGVLCGPCERGRRFEVEFRSAPGSRDEGPRARIADRGFPDLPDGAAVSAFELLRALEGDNRRYRELVGG
ncbi:hypothetical protein [Candidatus Palauibacter sp.]|uniref:hypothetical protein n=1 Tax=Candidatus Palauibacter sp. TaxID=3101350 RepID=UPI003B01BB49